MKKSQFSLDIMRKITFIFCLVIAFMLIVFSTSFSYLLILEVLQVPKIISIIISITVSLTFPIFIGLVSETRRKKMGNNSFLEYSSVLMVIFAEVFIIFITFLVILIIAIVKFANAFSGNFISDDHFPRSAYHSLVVDRNLIFVPDVTFEEQLHSFYSPDGSSEIQYRTNLKNNFEEIILVRDANREEILDFISHAKGRYTRFYWTDDNQILLFCFSHWVSGAPQNANFEEWCFSYDISSKKVTRIPDALKYLPETIEQSQ